MARKHLAVRMARRLLLNEVMPATMEERLDELLAMSREVGHLASELARCEHEVAWGAQSMRDKNRRRLRDMRKKHASAVSTLASARARLLAALPAEGAVS